MSKGKNTVEKTRKAGLCVSCEACSAVCPKSAISMDFSNGQFLPEIDGEKCIECELCYSVCPGMDADPHDYSKEENSAYDEKPLACYTAISKDEESLKAGISGGIVTHIVKELLKSKEYSAAYLLKYSKFNGKPARVERVTSSEKVASYAKSKYIPASIYNVILDMKADKGRKVIVVGTACQFQTVLKYAEKINFPRENLLFLGLVCDRTMNFNIYNYFEKKFAGGDEVKEFFFRTKDVSGWPGDSQIISGSGEEKNIPRAERMHVKDYFQLKRCLVCLSGKLNPQADITFGDCYLKGREDARGVSSVLVRTGVGKKVISLVEENLELSEEKYSEIYASQGVGARKLNRDFLVDGSKLRKVWRETKIRMGQREDFGTIGFLVGVKKISMKSKKVLRKLKKAFRIYWYALTVTKKPEKTKGDYLIVGGGMGNKGAQAMTFIAVNEIRQNNKNAKIYLCSDAENKDENKRKYNFDFLPWNINIKLDLLRAKPKEKELAWVLRGAKSMVDVSGYALGDQWGLNTALDYILNILVAKKYGLRVTLMPQSFGPFGYGMAKKIYLFPLFKILLPYPERIFAREASGFSAMKVFAGNNLKKSFDMVLYAKDYKEKSILKKPSKALDVKVEAGSVCIIPSKKMMSFVPEEKVFKLYDLAIEKILKTGRPIYLLAHSEEDLEICRSIKERHASECVKIVDSLPSVFEVEEILESFSFVIASRYHSVVHCYKQGTPAVVLGWAVKYKELLEAFGQDYFFDVRSEVSGKAFLEKVEQMMTGSGKERSKIEKKLEEVLKESDIFKEVSL